MRVRRGAASNGNCIARSARPVLTLFDSGENIQMSDRLPLRPRENCRVGLFSAAGRVEASALARAVTYFENAGHVVAAVSDAESAWRYFAGTDAQRLDNIKQVIADPEIDVAIATRGGYGVSRILDNIDWEEVAASRKVIVGFSDVTAFSLAALATRGYVTFSGPMGTSDFGRQNVNAFTETHFWSLLKNKTYTPDAINCEHDYAARRISGTIWGGNLSIVAHLVGTPYMPRVEDGILFVEDVAEESYAVERMCLQLEHAGILQRQKAVLLGAFTHGEPKNASNYPYSMDEVIETLRERLPCPVLTGFPVGHVADKITVPIGGRVDLNITSSGYQFTFSDYLADRV